MTGWPRDPAPRPDPRARTGRAAACPFLFRTYPNQRLIIASRSIERGLLAPQTLLSVVLRAHFSLFEPIRRALVLRKTNLIATVIAALIALRLVSGQLAQAVPKDQGTLSDRNHQRSANTEDSAMTRVRARVIHALLQRATVPVRGRTEYKRTVIVKAETSGTMIEAAAEKS